MMRLIYRGRWVERTTVYVAGGPENSPLAQYEWLRFQVCK